MQVKFSFIYNARREHFSIVSNSTGPPDVTDNETYTVFDPILDRAITMEELEKGIAFTNIPHNSLQLPTDTHHAVGPGFVEGSLRRSSPAR